MTAEIWRDIPGYEGLYQVSNFGRVKSFHCGRILKTSWRGKGYVSVTFRENRKMYVHRLVAEVFVPNPDNKPQVNHIDGVRTNNRADNLEWVTNCENVRHALARQFAGHKLTAAQVALIQKNPNRLTHEQLAHLFNVPAAVIRQIRRIGRQAERGTSRGRSRQPGMKSLF